MRFGILGFGKIARTTVFDAIEQAGHQVVAIGSARGAAPAAFQGQVFTDYDAMLDRRLMDALYIALPNHLHRTYTERALAAGIPVLCEKPIGLNAEEVAAIEKAAIDAGVHVQEAFMVAHHPQWQWLADQSLGATRKVLSVAFGYHNSDPLNIRNRAETGGGARLDIGCYGLWAANWLGARTIHSLDGVQWMGSGVDLELSGQIRFDHQVTLNLQVSMRQARFQQVVLQTESQCFVLPRPFNPAVDACALELDPTGAERRQLFHVNQSVEMIHHFCTQVAHNRPADLSASIRIADWSDQLHAQFTPRTF